MSKDEKKGGDTARLPDSECTIPPAIPHDALPDLMFNRDVEAARAIREYVEWQASDEKVTHAERITTEVVMGRRLDAWDVRTDKGRWWVITTPTNLYSQELFPSLDYAISFHVGVTVRMMSAPDRGVQPAEAAKLLSAWRKWEQAAEALAEAQEAEDFQAVGMRCRECLVSMVRATAEMSMIPADVEAPRQSDVIHWSEFIADYVAHGDSAENVRKYMKAVSRSGWQLVSWLTHASNATVSDATMAVDVTQHILAIFGTAIFRHEKGMPDRCPQCGSYKIGLRRIDDGDERVSCVSCDWMEG